MNDSMNAITGKPPFDLDRYKKAQAMDYEKALAEIRQGKKRGHWIWYIFPQLVGLGHSDMSWFFAIHSLEEAQAYMRDGVLGARLLEISQALLELETDNPTQVMGYPDDMKLCSCMTLFALAAPQHEVFKQVLDKYYHGKMDTRTRRILDEQAARAHGKGFRMGEDG